MNLVDLFTHARLPDTDDLHQHAIYAYVWISDVNAMINGYLDVTPIRYRPRSIKAREHAAPKIVTERIEQESSVRNERAKAALSPDPEAETEIVHTLERVAEKAISFDRLNGTLFGYRARWPTDMFATYVVVSVNYPIGARRSFRLSISGPELTSRKVDVANATESFEKDEGGSIWLQLSGRDAGAPDGAEYKLLLTPTLFDPRPELIR